MFYFNTFMIFSILGWLFEWILHFILKNAKQNILMGPWMPIYGIGLLLTDFLNTTLSKKYRGKKKVIYCFLYSLFLLTILEEIGGILIQFFFSTSYWNYESIPLSIGPYINILISIIWALMAIMLEYIVFPILSPFLKKIPRWVSIAIGIIFILDNFFGFLRNLKLHIFNKSLTFMRFIS